MANCNSLFTDFDSVIRLSEHKRKSLKRTRKDLKRKVKEYFKENKPNEIVPLFAGQGSFSMDTIINPIPRKKEVDGEAKYLYYYDIDYGIYFIGNESIIDRKSIQTYHEWICEAVDGHTQTPPVDKDTCVRVLFADGHNVDLPIYYRQNDVPELAHKAKGWIDSDPKKFMDWFEERATHQLRRIVRYLKAWCDYIKYKNPSKKMPSGLIITIVATNNFYEHQRDDIALKETLVKVQSTLEKSFKCERPTIPEGENLLEVYKYKDFFLSELDKFILNAKKALVEKNQKKACEYWQNSFGNRFSCQLARNEEEKSFGVAGLVIGSSHNKPWG